jgi:hypothetical protein
MNTQGSPTEGANVGQRPAGIRTVEGVQAVEGEVVVAVEAERKKAGLIRIGCNNINGIRKEKNNDRNRELQSFIATNQFDVMGMAETNLHWGNSKASPKDIVYGWFKRLHISFNYYKLYPCEAQFQVGGVLQLAQGGVTTRIVQHGGDTKGLG